MILFLPHFIIFSILSDSRSPQNVNVYALGAVGGCEKGAEKKKNYDNKNTGGSFLCCVVTKAEGGEM